MQICNRLFALIKLLDFLSRSRMEDVMKKREFQKKATAELFKRLVAVCAELGANPNITVSSKFHSSYFKLRNSNRSRRGRMGRHQSS